MTVLNTPDRMNKRWLRCLLPALWLVLAAAACDEEEAENPPSKQDAGASDAATRTDAGASCVTSPKTSVEILNACTDDDVESVDKKPELPLLLKDGGLPPLP